ncbi:ArsA family ATPase [Streptomyces sp. NPDC050560]|uniref:ArsA family ATPase n=1 Tax=Streptomyces sp. NPDC050560 TaxID=3365630 RepID=UPI0037ACDB2A
MRTVLVTGPGGAGRTTLAAATALAAGPATRTLLISADPTDTLGAVLGTPTGHTPTGIAPGLTALRPDQAAAFRDDFLALQQRSATALDLLGTAPFEADELAPLPGSAELALLSALRDAAAGPFDLVVVDLPATVPALTALALPERLRRYLRRLLPPERQAARALRPVLGRLAGVPVPAQWLYDAAGRWDLELAGVQSVIEDPATTARLVVEPGAAGTEALRTARMGLALHGVRVDAVLANRVLPGGTAAGPLAALAASQRKALAEWGPQPGSPPAPYEIPHLGYEPRGTDDLAALAAPPPGPAGAGERGRVTDRLAEDGVLVWALPLPGATRGELDLMRRGDELCVAAGPFHRVLELPSVLRRCTVAGAGLREGELRVRFAPDPELWPRER